MKKVKILEVKKEALKRIDMICKFTCCNYSIKQKVIIDEYCIDLNVSTEDDVCDNLKVIVSIIN